MIEKDCHIYRFLSFFDLYKILNEKKLRFRKLAKMTDKNEGLGEVLSLHEDLQLVGYISDEKNVREQHDYTLESNFICCWTKTSESIAIWSLYSEENCGIRIKTSLRKLNLSLMNFSGNNYAYDFHPDIKQGQQVTIRTNLNDVEYVDFYELKEKIRQRFLDFKLGNIKDWHEFQKNSIIGHNGWRFKDEAYSHEQEIRALISLGIRNSVTKEKWRENMPINLPFDSPSPGTLSDDIYVDVDDNFLEEICFDPRCPQFKREVFENIIDIHNVKIVESKAFGYAPNIESFALKTD